MANDNNVTIGTMGSSNSIYISQNQNETPGHIEYEIIPNSIERISRETANRGTLSFFGSVALPVLAVVADVLGVFSFLGIQTKWVLSIVLPIALIGALLNNSKWKLSTTFFRSNEARFINGKWVEKSESGDFVLYRKSASCIYPKCQGTVQIQPAPPREHPNHSLVGVCDIGGYRHTYTVDFNGVGYPQQFDWRPIEENKS